MFRLGIEVYDETSGCFDSFVESFGEDILSTPEEIRVVEIGRDAVVVYKASEFLQLNPETTMQNLNTLLEESIDDDMYLISFTYHSDPPIGISASNRYIVYRNTVFAMRDAITSHDDWKLALIPTEDPRYRPTKDYFEAMADHDEENNEEDEDISDLDDLDEVEPDDDEEDISNDPFDGFDPEPKHRKKFSVRKSAVFSGSCSPKKQFRHNGVVVAAKQSHIEKDRAMIKAFLKQFIPGKSPWIKRYRNKILKRWMKMYMVDKKTIKKFYKEQQSKKTSKRKKKLVGMTHRLLQNDPWNDPNK